MYAHINTWKLSQDGTPADNTSAVGVAARLREQPGFVSYDLVRTGDREVTAITLFRSRDQLEAAMKTVSGYVDEIVRRYVKGKPHQMEGDVLHHEAGVVLTGDV